MSADFARALDDGQAGRDVEAVAFIKRLVGAWDCCGTCAGGVLASRDTAQRTRIAAAIRAEADRICAQRGCHVAGNDHAELMKWAAVFAQVVERGAS